MSVTPEQKQRLRELGKRQEAKILTELRNPKLNSKRREQLETELMLKRVSTRVLDLKDALTDEAGANDRIALLEELVRLQDQKPALQSRLEEISSRQTTVEDIQLDPSLNAKQKRSKIWSKLYSHAEREATAAGKKPGKPIGEAAVQSGMIGMFAATGVAALEPRAAWTVLPCGAIAAIFAALASKNKNDKYHGWIKTRHQELMQDAIQERGRETESGGSEPPF